MKKLITLLSLLALNNRDKIYCDIKGSVKNPGVYEIKENYTIQDIIKDAGGLKKESYTKNINLSKKVKDEMVIYIFNNSEIKKIEELNNCSCEPIYKYIECEETTGEITTTNPTTNIITNTTKKTSNAKTQTTTKPQTTTITSSTTKVNNTTKPVTTTKHITTIKHKININNATVEELETLNGLGRKKAEAIIEFRNDNGLFNIIEDIMNVSGIGKSTFEKIKEDIEV